MSLVPTSIWFLLLQLTQNVFPSTGCLIVEIAKSYKKQDLESIKGVVEMEFDFRYAVLSPCIVLSQRSKSRYPKIQTAFF